jgi:hypothetical protein
MPKETVYGDQLPFGEDNPGRSQVEVSWGGGVVQVVTKCVHGATGDRLSDGEGIHYTDGFYVDLNRKGINELIRNLRKARDRAYGRDE